MPSFSTELAQAVAIGLTAAQTGLVANSVLAVHAFKEWPVSETTRIWRTVYLRGKPIHMFLSLVSGSLWTYLAYHATDLSARRLYATSAAIIPTFIAFSLVVQKPIDKNLIEAARSDKTDPARIRQAFDSWYKLSAVRALLIGTAAATGIWAVVSKY